MNHVLDACAMLAYLRGEHGAAVVASLFYDPDETCYAHAVNLCEVYYDFLRRTDEPTARQAIADLITDGVIERGDMDTAFSKRSGNKKHVVGFHLPTVSGLLLLSGFLRI